MSPFLYSKSNRTILLTPSYHKTDMIPQDSRVEIDAKINAGYFTTGKTFTMEELAQVKGRGWEKWEDVAVCLFLPPFPLNSLS